MKKTIITICLFAGILAASAQSAKYQAAMEKNLLLLDSAKSTQQLQDVSAAFERIGNAEKTQWLPFYYAGLAQTTIGFVDQTADKDAIGNKALELAGKAEEINKNAEIKGLYYMAYIIQLLVDPMNRYQTYGTKANQALAEGLLLDSLNPRLYYLKGSGLLGTPTFAGGGKDKAKPVLEKALELFNTEKTQPLYPHWGKNLTEQALEKCK